LHGNNVCDVIIAIVISGDIQTWKRKVILGPTGRRFTGKNMEKEYS